MKKIFFDIVHLLRDSASDFFEKDPLMLAGALAFFTVFAIPPILIMIIYGIGLFTGQEVAAQQVFSRIGDLMGQEGADLLRNIVEHYFVADRSLVQQLLSIGIFLFASSSFFLIIQHALNIIWRVKPKSGKAWVKVLENRALSFGIIVVMGIIFAFSLVSQSLLFSVQGNINDLTPWLTPFLVNLFSILISLLVGTLILATVYKFLPDVVIGWKEVWVGAFITSFLFTLAKFIISFALQRSNVAAMYGNVGAMAIFLLWVFYSSLILFYGAQITHEYAESFAKAIKPKDHAVRYKEREFEK